MPLTPEPDGHETPARDRPFRVDKYGRQDTIVVDLDGTLLEDRYPELGEWLPGAKEALHAFLKAGYAVSIFSCRFHSNDAHTWEPRKPEEVDASLRAVREKLNAAGLQRVAIILTNKPPARWYIDDRAVAFKGNWRKIVRKICG